MKMLDERSLEWLDSSGVGTEEFTPLRGDVSPRRYFRVYYERGNPAIVASYPAPQASTFSRFLITTGLFENAGIRVPRILASNASLGLMLLEDLGDSSVFDSRDSPWSDLRSHLEAAMRALTSLAALPPAEFALINPLLDAARLADELRDARHVFLDSEAFSGRETERTALYAALDELSGALSLEPLVPSHRDFMSRNLMLPPDRLGLAIIDHQDACLAPRSYDLASLLNDSLFLSRSREEELLEQALTDPGAWTAYRRCAVQRALKATATYVKFARRGFGRHLPLVAPTLERAAFQLEQLPEGRLVPASVLSRWRDDDAVGEGLRFVVGAAPQTSSNERC